MTSKISAVKNSILIVTFALLPLAAVGVSAQTKDALVDVPFAFVANHTSLPAGHYKIVAQDSMLTFINADTGKSEAVLLSRPETGNSVEATGKLRFYVSGNRHLLTDVRFGGTDTHNMLLRQPKPEHVVARNTEPAAQTTEIATR